jgi:hypothetical protein
MDTFGGLMVSGFLVRVALAAFALVPISYATPISLGFIEFKDIGTSGLQTKFTFNNWTNNIGGYDVLSAVNFINVSLTIDHDGLIDDPVGLPFTSLAPDVNQWSSNAVSKSFAITRAVFRATLNPADVWALVGGGFFVPVSGQLVMVMLPSGGPAFQTPVTAGLAAAPGDSWNIVVASAIPEPASLMLSGAGLLGVLLVGRRRRG